MLHFLFLLASLLTLAVFPNGFAFANTVTDDDGSQIKLQNPAKRIISLAPDITELLFAIGAGDEIKAVVDSSDYPAKARKLPKIGNYSGVDLEQIIRLQPDLIVAWNNTFVRPLITLRKMGMPIFITRPIHLEDVARNMQKLGILTGHAEPAQKAAACFLRDINDLRSRYAAKKKLRVYYQIGAYSLLTINHQSWINEAISICGGINIFADALSVTPEITWEALLLRHPQVIISDTALKNLLNRFGKWHILAAVDKKQLYSIKADWIDRAGPRLARGVLQICEAIDKARHIY